MGLGGADDRPRGWDPARYLEYADERARPFLDLLARVPARDPRTVVDLGCGPGNLTAVLAERWPGADVHGLDSSAEMVAAARRAAAETAGPSARVRYEVADLRTWRPAVPADVVVSNAVLQWLPGHLDLLPALVAGTAPGGWLALQVPGNFSAPSHTERHRLEDDPRFAPHLRDVVRPYAHDAKVYLDALADLGCSVDAWETTYLHVLPGDDPVLAWTLGTGARPTVETLPPGPREEFLAEYRRALRAAYPPGRHGTVLPFRRVFAVARVPAGG